MHLLLLSLLAGGETPARFGADGLHLGPVVVSDATLTMTPDGRLLASRTQLESLGAPLAVEVGHGRVVVVDPGLRVSATAKGLVLTTHQGRKLALRFGGEQVVVASPATLSATEAGLVLDGRTYAVAQADAFLAQDGVDENLDRMMKAKEQAGSGNKPTPPSQRKPGTFDWSRVFNPFVVGKPADGDVVTSGTQKSAVGF